MGLQSLMLLRYCNHSDFAEKNKIGSIFVLNSDEKCRCLGSRVMKTKVYSTIYYTICVAYVECECMVKLWITNILEFICVYLVFCSFYLLLETKKKCFYEIFVLFKNSISV